MLNNSVRPEDLLPDGVDKAIIGGKEVRKGSVAAFLANVNIVENPNSTPQQIHDSIKAMEELAPTLIAVGLHKHVIFKNSQVEKILSDAEK